MALGWSEIRSRAITFAYEWRDKGYEKGDSQTFWNDFFEVFGISRKRVADLMERYKALVEKKKSHLPGGLCIIIKQHNPCKCYQSGLFIYSYKAV